MKRILFSLLVLATILVSAHGSEITIRESQKESDGKIYREKRWLRSESVILVETWLTRASDGTELNHMQMIVRDGKTLFSISKLKNWSALASDLGDIMLAFELSETGQINQIHLFAKVKVVELAKVEVVERYIRRGDGFYDPLSPKA